MNGFRFFFPRARGPGAGGRRLHRDGFNTITIAPYNVYTHTHTQMYNIIIIFFFLPPPPPLLRLFAMD